MSNDEITNRLWEIYGLLVYRSEADLRNAITNVKEELTKLIADIKQDEEAKHV